MHKIHYIQFSVLILAFSLFVYGCGGTNIPDFKISLTESELKTLESTKPIQLISNPSPTYTSSECSNNHNHDYVLSKGSSLNSEYAYWECESFYTCPDLKIDMINNLPFVTSVDGDQDQYSKSEIEACAKKVINYATTTQRMTPRHAFFMSKKDNKDSWKS